MISLYHHIIGIIGTELIRGAAGTSVYALIMHLSIPSLHSLSFIIALHHSIHRYDVGGVFMYRRYCIYQVGSIIRLVREGLLRAEWYIDHYIVVKPALW